jgi:succinate dehydrogenase/fumarate reductase flavoprotein subunit
MLDLVVVDGRARGIVVRDMVTGEVQPRLADAVVPGTGGYGNVFFSRTNAKGCNPHGGLAGAQARRLLRQPVLHADPSDLHSRVRRAPDPN